MKPWLTLMMLLSAVNSFAAPHTPTLFPSATQQRLQNEMSTQQQLHQSQLHIDQQNRAQQLEQNNQLHQQQMLRKIQTDQP